MRFLFCGITQLGLLGLFTNEIEMGQIVILRNLAQPTRCAPCPLHRHRRCRLLRFVITKVIKEVKRNDRTEGPELKMPKAEDIIRRYRNTLHELAK